MSVFSLLFSANKRELIILEAPYAGRMFEILIGHVRNQWNFFGTWEMLSSTIRREIKFLQYYTGLPTLLSIINAELFTVEV